MPSSVRIRSAAARPADDDAPSANLLEIERVHRLAHLEHHVVGDVDDVVDRADAGGFEPLAQPVRATGRSSRRTPARSTAGHRSGASMSRPRCDSSPARPVRATRRARRASCSGSPQIADASRASPTWFRQSGRLAVISKSMTGIAAVLDRRDLEAAQADLAARRVSDVGGDGDELRQPRVDESHSGNCSRKRRSFS